MKTKAGVKSVGGGGGGGGGWGDVQIFSCA